MEQKEARNESVSRWSIEKEATAERRGGKELGRGQSYRDRLLTEQRKVKKGQAWAGWFLWRLRMWRFAEGRSQGRKR